MATIIEKEIYIPNTLSIFNLVVVDGCYLTHAMDNVPKTFENISKQIISTLSGTTASQIDVIFDQFFSPLIKDKQY